MIYLFLFLAAILSGIGFYHSRKKIPPGLSSETPDYSGSNVRFFSDLTWEEEGILHQDQHIFEEIICLVNQASRYVMVDMFLFNDLRGRGAMVHKDISLELTEALLDRKEKYPDMFIVVVTDPVNIVYGGYTNPYLTRLDQAGIKIVITDLDVLRDSNILYSPFWRLFIRLLGTGRGKTLPNPFGRGRISLRSYFRLLNFKANHRKLVVADHNETMAAIVTSANMHDGSSMNGNVAVGFSGQAAVALWRMEEAVIRFSGDMKIPEIEPVKMIPQNGQPTLKLVSEGQIKKNILAELARTEMGDQVYLVLFYLSDRDIIHAMKKASLRGVMIRIVLDPNKDAFGRQKSGIPNRQTASELVGEGVAIRWGRTSGEQLHSKMMLVDYSRGESNLVAGSANYTRRNLDDFNLEVNVVVRGNRNDQVFSDARRYCSLLWNGDQGREFSVDYRRYAEKSNIRRLFYRVVEATGLCTF